MQKYCQINTYYAIPSRSQAFLINRGKMETTNSRPTLKVPFNECDLLFELPQLKRKEQTWLFQQQRKSGIENV